MDHKTLHERAEEIFKIRCECFDETYLSCDTIGIDGESVDIMSHYYDSCCGDTTEEFCSFPSDLLLASDEDARAHFQKEYRELVKWRNEQQEKQRAEDAKKQEEMEIQQLIRLLNKYGDIRNERNEQN